MVSVTVPYGRILGFLYRSHYFFFQVAPQLYSWGWLDPVPDPLLLRKSGSAGNRTQTSGSVARNSNDKTTDIRFWHLCCFYCFVWELMLVSFWYVLYTAIIHKTRPLPVALLYQERAVDISYNKCTQQNAWCHFSQKFRNNLKDYCWNSVSLFFQNSDIQLGLNISVMLATNH
jgi:hypothetical protein